MILRTHFIGLVCLVTGLAGTEASSAEPKETERPEIRLKQSFSTPKENPLPTTATAAGCMDHSDKPAQCVALGVHYETGQGVGQDLLLAGKLYDEACMRGDGFACLRLGSLAISGQDSNTSRAKKAAKKSKAMILRTGGDPTADLKARQRASLELAIGLEIASFKPSIFPKERSLAFQRRACELKDAELCFVLGQDQRATPTHFSTQQAKAFISTACTLGHKAACVVTQEKCFPEPVDSACPDAAGGIVGGIVGATSIPPSQLKDVKGKGFFRVHNSEVKITSRQIPEVSEPLRVYLDKVGEPECHLNVLIQTDGVPIRATPTQQCAPELRESAVDCILQWRWKLTKGLREQNIPVMILERVVFYD